MTPFNAADFLDAQVNEPMSYEIAPVPEGEYQGRVDDSDDWLAIEEIQGKKDPTKKFTKGTVMIEIIDAKLKQDLKREKIRQRFQFFIDFKSDGTLDFDQERNIGLGSLRHATGQNTPGPWAPRQLRGAGPFMVRIKQRSDENDPSRKYSEVGRIAPIK